jgi:hypothetical protein
MIRSMALLRCARLLGACALLLGLLAPLDAHAKGSVQLRVIVPRAAVRVGPGYTYRELYRAERGEVLAVVERNSTYWFRVILPDGRFGWIYGEEVIPFVVDLAGGTASQRWARFRDAIFSPSPIPSSRAGFTFSGGVLGGDGMFMFRPSLTLDAHVSLEAHVGESVGADGSLLLYGLDTVGLLWPQGPFCPFVALGAGGATTFPKVDGVTQSSSTQWALDAGGGAMIFFRKLITLRFDFRNYTLFTPNARTNRQEYSGALAIYF